MFRGLSPYSAAYTGKRKADLENVRFDRDEHEKNGWKFHDGKCVYIPAGGKCDVGPLYVWKCDTVSGGIRKEWCNGTDEV